MKAKIKQDFTMGGISYKFGEIYDFTEDQVKRLPHLLDVNIENQNIKPKSFEVSPMDKMVGSKKRNKPKNK